MELQELPRICSAVVAINSIRNAATHVSECRSTFFFSTLPRVCIFPAAIAPPGLVVAEVVGNGQVALYSSFS